MTGDKIRFRFQKGNALRMISHLDTMRCFERMLRRAEIPFKRTQGFHPCPRFVLALSLPLGVLGVCEVAELELTEPRDANEIVRKLNQAAPDGLVINTFNIVPMKATAIVRRSVYRVDNIPQDKISDVSKYAQELLAQPKVWVERLKPKPRGLNIKPYLRDIR
jgi:radical SAM-linked protein